MTLHWQDLKWQWLVALFGALLLSGCATSGAEKKIDFSYTINASADINPDINGDPSSVVLQVYQLSNAGNFTAALYEDLFNADTSVLAAELIGVDKYLIDPASSQHIETGISPNTKFIGVAVGYREIELVTWKVLQPVSEDSLLDSINLFANKGLVISIEARNVRVTQE